MLELGTRVQITRQDAYHYGRYGIIDRIDTRGETLYHVTDPYRREKLEYWRAHELTPTTAGKPEVSDETRAIGRDLLLAPHRARMEREAR